MNDLFPNMTSPNDNLDWELVLYFLSDYQALEGALVRAGYSRAGRLPGTIQPDWNGFARHIAGRFDPEASPELIGAVCTLLADPEAPGFLRKRQAGACLWEPSIPERNTNWLLEVVEEIHNRLVLWVNSVQVPVCDDSCLLAALVFLEACATIDPKVESHLAYAH